MKKTLLALTLSIISISSLMAQSVAVTSLNTNPAEVNSDFIVNIEYSTTNVNDIIYIALELKNSDGNWAATIVEAFVNPVGTSGTDVATSSVITIPSSTTPSADLTGGQYYELKVELNAEGWAGWLAGDYPAMTLVAEGTLSVKENQINQLRVYPNPATKHITIQKSNDKIETITLINLLGESVYSIYKANTNSIDVSNLPSGMYILSVNSGIKVKQTKFVKL
ncbi:T9SS type A sorting domain-containing protein [Flavivirga spongiicola]|uniref:T9SS type A sorting domain-containing protein n=1 Tax=Flavivirga spongiicola TaxID=421621 RepID=A0ABU7XYC6_9FLAO|nr:T9SS type A sorting domain-containing protein [Flavivirga sp. MEBiC05379]MDO5980801.1 T9SS type A sorting domain-containing protein [Flavivirga sp. MEBiC05379]